MSASYRQRVKEDLLTLAENKAFMRWLGRWVDRAGLLADLPTTNGGDIQRFMGRRSVLVEITADFEREAPGFLLRVMEARRSLAAEYSNE